MKLTGATATSNYGWDSLQSEAGWDLGPTSNYRE